MSNFYNIDLVTTKKGNHAINLPNGLFIGRVGNVIPPIFKNESKGLELYPTIRGSFVIQKQWGEYHISQVVEILRTKENEENCYKARLNLLNSTKDGEWQEPLIGRIAKEVEEYVLRTKIGGTQQVNSDGDNSNKGDVQTTPVNPENSRLATVFKKYCKQICERFKLTK